MAKFILFLDRLVNFYLYYVVLACFLSFVPNINYNYPLFHFIFKSAGFYIIAPVLGISFSPMVVMICCVLTSMGLAKIYKKYYTDKEHSVIILTKDEFERNIKLFNKTMIKKIGEGKKDNDTNDNN